MHVPHNFPHRRLRFPVEQLGRSTSDSLFVLMPKSKNANFGSLQCDNATWVATRCQRERNDLSYPLQRQYVKMMHAV
jgi:hypothetical protein